MKKYILWSLLMGFHFCAVNGQSRFEYVSTYTEAEKRTSAIRNACLSYVFDGEYQKLEKQWKTRLIVDLSDHYKDTLAVFSGKEQQLFSYWINQYAFIANSYAATFDESPEVLATDSLYRVLSKHSLKNLSFLENQITQPKFNQEKEDFLRLYLHYLIANSPLTEITKENVLRIAGDFINNHPESDYNPFIRNHVLLEYNTSNFGIGFSLLAGYSVSTKSLNNYFGNNSPVGGEFNFLYKRLRLDVDFTGSMASHLGSTFEYKGQWDEDTRYTQATGSANMGIELVSNEKFAIYPFAGITSTTVSSYVRDDAQGEEENVKLSYFPGYQFGLSFEKRFAQDKNFTSYKERFITEHSRNYWSIKVKGGVSFPGFQNESDMFSGQFIFIKISVGILTHPAAAVTKSK